MLVVGLKTLTVGVAKGFTVCEELGLVITVFKLLAVAVLYASVEAAYLSGYDDTGTALLKKLSLNKVVFHLLLLHQTM